MNLKFITSILFCVTSLLSYSQENIIELPLSTKNGYGPLKSALLGKFPYSDSENDPWIKTRLKMSRVPENLVDVKIGEFNKNRYQSVYQDYLLGNISKELYEELQKSWNWQPDTLNLSKEPLKCKIGFAIGKDSSGAIKMVLDANNNLDFSDDKLFTPVIFDPNTKINRDSLALDHSINVTYESFQAGEKTLKKAPLFITYMSQEKLVMYNFPQYETTNFLGQEIAICSNAFTDLLYQDPNLVLVNDEGKAMSKNEITKNEYLELKGDIYKIISVNLNKNILAIQKATLPKNQLISTQVGFKAFPFEGDDFKTKTQISLENLKANMYCLIFGQFGVFLVDKKFQILRNCTVKQINQNLRS